MENPFFYSLSPKNIYFYEFIEQNLCISARYSRLHQIFMQLRVSDLERIEARIKVHFVVNMQLRFAFK